MARPTTYTPEVVAAAWEYLDTFDTEYDHAVPSVVGLCQVINRSRTTLYDWAADPEKEFSDILAAIKEKQELVTFSRALKGEYNATIAKLLLGKHGYHERTEHTGEDGAAIKTVTTIELVPLSADSSD